MKTLIGILTILVGSVFVADASATDGFLQRALRAQAQRRANVAKILDQRQRQRNKNNDVDLIIVREQNQNRHKHNNNNDVDLIILRNQNNYGYNNNRQLFIEKRTRFAEVKDLELLTDQYGRQFILKNGKVREFRAPQRVRIIESQNYGY